MTPITEGSGEDVVERIAEISFNAGLYGDDEDEAPSWKELCARIDAHDLPLETERELVAVRDHQYKIASALASAGLLKGAERQAIPDGYVLVPKEPSNEMIEALAGGYLTDQEEAFAYVESYHAMLSVAKRLSQPNAGERG